MRNGTQDNFIESSLEKSDPLFEVPLRPQSLSEFIGQSVIRECLEVLIGAAKKRGDPLCHCLFSGPPGLGKTTLAHILAKAMGTSLVVTSGPVLEKAGDLAGVLTGLKKGDVLFIDEIHRLNRAVEEYLYQAMEDFSLDLMIDSGPNARSVQVKINPFTLVGATTRLGLLSEPLRTRFGYAARLEYYSIPSLIQVLERAAPILKVRLNPACAQEIAKRSRGTPRVANHLLRFVRDFADMRNQGIIDSTIIEQALALLNIDEKGLDELDIKMLQVMIEQYQGGPVGINAIAASIGEEPTTIEEVYEPYLILQGFLRRTPRGREVTELAYSHLATTN